MAMGCSVRAVFADEWYKSMVNMSKRIGHFPSSPPACIKNLPKAIIPCNTCWSHISCASMPDYSRTAMANTMIWLAEQRPFHCTGFIGSLKVLEFWKKFQALESPRKVLEFECSIFWNFCVLKFWRKHSSKIWHCVGWQVILCDPIWQATPRSSEMDFHLELNTALTLTQL